MRRGKRRRGHRSQRFLPPFLGQKRRPWPIYLLDLDNTLYDANRHCFPLMHRHIHGYLMARLALNEGEAAALRHSYWRRYGTTLAGLQRHHPEINPKEFLQAIHPPELAASVPGNVQIENWLRQLDGPAYIFTNSIADHAERVLLRLGIAQQIQGIFDMLALGLRGKPASSSYRKVLRDLRVPAWRCQFFDDSSHNLRPARMLGMKTTWVHPILRRRKGQLSSLPPPSCSGFRSKHQR